MCVRASVWPCLSPPVGTRPRQTLTIQPLEKRPGRVHTSHQQRGDCSSSASSPALSPCVLAILAVPVRVTQRLTVDLMCVSPVTNAGAPLHVLTARLLRARFLLLWLFPSVCRHEAGSRVPGHSFSSSALIPCSPLPRGAQSISEQILGRCPGRSSVLCWAWPLPRGRQVLSTVLSKPVTHQATTHSGERPFRPSWEEWKMSPSLPCK